MQNWDKNRQDIKFKQKLNNVKSTLPKISYSNNQGGTLSKKSSNNTPSNQNYNNLENLYLNTNLKLQQLERSGTINANSSRGKSKEIKQQNYIKHLLNEFGLSQYLKKIYELGYDDSNVNKIGLMDRKSFQEFIVKINIYTNQTIKFEKICKN
mgnify:CR=1 FL=1